jgi:phosphoribosylformylglycinamidine synthase
MEGAVIPVVTAHGEGRAEFASAPAARACSDSGLVCARYVDNHQAAAVAAGRAAPDGGPLYTDVYPLNPNGSPFGMTALTTRDGRCTIIMPHPERVFRTVQHSWAPPTWGEDGPWMRFFRNARTWVG